MSDEDVDALTGPALALARIFYQSGTDAHSVECLRAALALRHQRPAEDGRKCVKRNVLLLRFHRACLSATPEEVRRYRLDGPVWDEEGK